MQFRNTIIRRGLGRNRNRYRPPRNIRIQKFFNRPTPDKKPESEWTPKPSTPWMTHKKPPKSSNDTTRHYSEEEMITPLSEEEKRAYMQMREKPIDKDKIEFDGPNTKLKDGEESNLLPGDLYSYYTYIKEYKNQYTDEEFKSIVKTNTNTDQIFSNNQLIADILGCIPTNPILNQTEIYNSINTKKIVYSVYRFNYTSNDEEVGTISSNDEEVGTILSNDEEVGTILSNDEEVGTILSNDEEVGTISSNDEEVGTISIYIDLLTLSSYLRKLPTENVKQLSNTERIKILKKKNNIIREFIQMHIIDSDLYVMKDKKNIGPLLYDYYIYSDIDEHPFVFQSNNEKYHVYLIQKPNQCTTEGGKKSRRRRKKIYKRSRKNRRQSKTTKSQKYRL